MRRKNIIGVAIFVGVVALLFGTWHFLVRERMKKYSDDREKLAQLGERYVTLSERFAGYRPEHVAGVYEEQVAPWASAVQSRSQFFTSGHEDRVPKVPDGDPNLIRTWYEEQIAKAIRSLGEEMASKLYSPPLVDFNVPTASTLFGKDVNQLQAFLWLTRQETGAAMVRRLLDANVPAVRGVQMSKDPVPTGLFNVTFYVLVFDADFGTLAGLLNSFTRGDMADVREGEHFYNVPAIQIHNPNLSYPRPMLEIQMVVVEAEYNPRGSAAPQPSTEERLAILGGPRIGPGMLEGAPTVKEKTWWQSFRRNWLPF